MREFGFGSRPYGSGGSAGGIRGRVGGESASAFFSGGVFGPGAGGEG